MKLGSESLPLCFLDLRHNNNPKASHNEKQKNIKPSSLDRLDKAKTYDYNVTGKQKETTKQIPATNNKFWFVPVVCAFSRHTDNQL